MSLTTDGKAPGPVRFHLRCDRRDCEARAVFELVITQPRPDIEKDFGGYVLHEATAASPHISELGWTFTPGDVGYWCPRCAGRRSGPPLVTVAQDPTAPGKRPRRRRPR